MNKGLKDDSSNKGANNTNKKSQTVNKSINDTSPVLEALNGINNKLAEVIELLAKKSGEISNKLDKLNKTMNDRFDELSLSINLIETGSGKNDIFDFLAQEGGVGPGIEESFSMENSMDSSDLDELPDEVYRYEDY